MAIQHIKTITLDYRKLDHSEMIKRSEAFYVTMGSRRSVRHFSNKPVSLDVIKTCIKTAGSAPSGANRQP